jgi:uncharacterized protein with HEPN domain
MQLKVKALLHDIEQAIDLIDHFTSSKSFDGYSNDPMARSAVERQLVIIWRDTQPTDQARPAIVANISDHRRIIGLRNILVHGYAKVDDRVVWSIVKDSVPRLGGDVKGVAGEG